MSRDKKRHGIKIIERQPNLQPYTFPSEIVKIQLNEKTKIKVFCKYSSYVTHKTHGHRGNVEYETKVYRNILRHLHLFAPGHLHSFAPKFWGAHYSKKTKNAWLIIEYLGESTYLTRMNITSSKMIRLAANWLADFHTAGERYMKKHKLSFMKKYTKGYYLGWANRTKMFTRSFHRHYPWLPKICDKFRELIPELLKAEPTIIHGELYPAELFIRNNNIYAIDWETSAIAAGEIDLASITEHWAKPIANKGINEYKKIRWPKGAPKNFERLLNIARLYWHFRWLGDNTAWTLHTSPLRFRELHQVGRRLGLI